MNFPLLQQLGLNQNESLIYGLLLKHGSMKASDIEDLAKIGRGNVYNVLTSLQKHTLVLPIEGKQTRFQPVNPMELRKLLDQKMAETKALESVFRAQLPDLTSAFNLSTGKPAIQIFEGLEGAKQALHASLQSKTEILTYFDVSSLKGLMAETNKRYVKKRIERKIPKRIIVADSKEAHVFFEQQNTIFTKVAFLKNYPEQHASAMEIYDDTISYLTLVDEKRISILLKDHHIYKMHKQQFDYLWSQATEIIDYAARTTAPDSKDGSKTA